MYQGKHSSSASEKQLHRPVRSAAPRHRAGPARKSISLFLALVVILSIAIGGTIAWLKDSQSITNAMVPGNVPVSIGESISGTSKNQITLTNEGNVQAYLRVAVISNSLDEDGNIIPNNSSSTITTNGNWTQIGNYYYYNGIVEPGASVDLLGSAIDFSSSEVVVMAQTVQVLGSFDEGTASQKIWGVSFNGTSWA